MSWTLILLVITYNGAAAATTTVQEFASKELCIAAGADAKTAVEKQNGLRPWAEARVTASFSCVAVKPLRQSWP
jgi:hypothetical protein